MENDDSGSVPLREEDATSGNSGSIGEMLRREREKRQISIETIAAKLRLNAKFIEALEQDRYELLPGDTYIRVYLRSLAQYLSLDSEDIFRRFFNERGLSGVDTLRKDSSTKISLPALEERKKPGMVIPLVIVLVVVLAGLGFIARKHRLLSAHSSKTTVMVADSAGRSAAALADTNKGTGGAADESSGAVAESSRAVAAPAADSLHQPMAGGSGPMKLQILVKHDSCRVRVYTDGKEWQKVMHRGGWITFFAQDSFNIFVSVSDAVTLTVDGKAISLPARTGASAIKVGRTGIVWWTLEKWESTFH